MIGEDNKKLKNVARAPNPLAIPKKPIFAEVRYLANTNIFSNLLCLPVKAKENTSGKQQDHHN
ncbi:hypothetical protein ABE67_18540 [Cytobacillus firmus]|uniref:hypothetical protein n=1 Tax=Cytobacillus firmus TaxID=1399 RepID=UPI0018CF0184|nr:hypothetical protein [Cytobacillus firmus]MBG9451236.1 hypothetical protein [Cytobacillus firmus]